MKKKVLAIVLATSLALSLGLASAALAAWQEGGGTDWYYVDASYGGYHNSVGLDIQLDGDSSAGQIFYVGDTITISGDTWSFSPTPRWIKVTNTSDNNDTFRVSSYTSSTFTLDASETLTAEANTSATLNVVGEVYRKVLPGYGAWKRPL